MVEMLANRPGMLVNPLEQRTYAAISTAARSSSVLVKPRLVDLVDPDSAEWTVQERNYIWKAHVDFVLCDARLFHLPTIVAIEVDGASHRDVASRKRDSMKTSILARAGLPLWRFSTTDVDDWALPGWIAHVVELAEFERNLDTDEVGHPPMWHELEGVKNCSISRQTGRLVVEVLDQLKWACGAEDCREGSARTRVSMTVGKRTCIGESCINILHLPVNDRMLRALTTELAQYLALKDLGVWHLDQRKSRDSVAA